MMYPHIRQIKLIILSGTPFKNRDGYSSYNKIHLENSYFYCNIEF